MLCVTNMLLHGIEDPELRPPRQHARPALYQLRHVERPGRHRPDQSALRWPRGRRHRDELPQAIPDPRNRRPLPRPHHPVAQVRTVAPPWSCPTVPSSAKASRPGSRNSLMEECNLHTIVRLPNSVFKPYASCRHQLPLFFEKGEPTKEDLVLRAPRPRGAESLLDDQADPRGAPQALRGMVGRRRSARGDSES